MDILAKPLLFISHKHYDRPIALSLAEFVRSNTLGKVDIFLSSDAAFEGPRFGKDLNTELRSALWKSDVLILIYTSEEHDWSYCMWECGVANDSNSPDTNVIVFQCGGKVPAVLQGSLHVNVRDILSLQEFCHQFFTDPKFFPSLTEPLAQGFEKEQTDQKAKELADKMAVVIPPPVLIRDWPTWPFVQVELPLSEVDRIRAAARPGIIDELAKLVRERGVISDHDSRAPGIFGLANLETQTMLRFVAESWLNEYPGADLSWFDCCCHQIAIAADDRSLHPQTIVLREAGGVVEYAPVLSRVRRFEWEDKVRFDFYLYQLPEVDAVPLQDKMLTVDRFYWRNLDQLLAEKTTLRQLNQDLKSQQRYRVPLLDQNMFPKFVIHRSMIDQFIVDHLDDPRGASTLTIEDLLTDARMRAVFENSFAVVGCDATLKDAKIMMQRNLNCRDIFVTAGGTAAEPVLGWLTNVDLEIGKRVVPRPVLKS